VYVYAKVMMSCCTANVTIFNKTEKKNPKQSSYHCMRTDKHQKQKNV